MIACLQFSTLLTSKAFEKLYQKTVAFLRNRLGATGIQPIFNQPEFVICDINLLRTLPEREIICGFAEIVKHAAIADPDLFPYLEEHYKEALELDAEVVERLVYDSVFIKSKIVSMDEKERGVIGSSISAIHLDMPLKRAQGYPMERPSV